MNTARLDLFAVAAPGLEPVVAAELTRLRAEDVRAAAGGVRFTGNLREVARANLWLRAASRVLVRVAEFDAPGRRELAARAARSDLSPWFEAASPVAIHASTRKSRLYHTGLVEEVLREALRLAAPPKGPHVPDAAGTLHVRLQNDRCTLSVDASGELLHRRGWREEGSHAPLRESLAAGLLQLAGFDGTQAFADPMCGSGTLAIEAALLATARAPGRNRTFAFERFPSFDGRWLEELKQEADAGVRPAAARVLGADIHAGALGAARRNAARAGVESVVSFERCDAARLAAPAERGTLVTNPPYGHRLEAGQDALAALDTALRGAFARWHRAFLAPTRGRRAGVGLPVGRVHRLDNGGIPVELIELADAP